ncbi:MAG: oligosaccharide flippase family protein [Cyanobacteria bacterium P01_H01_bin.15]
MTEINTRKVTGGILWTTLSYLNNRLLKVLAQAVLARMLTPELFGIWAMVQVQLVFYEIFRESSIAQVLVQRDYRDRTLSNAVYSFAIDFAIGLFIVQIILGYFISEFFGSPIVWPLTAAAAVTLLISAGSTCHRSVLVHQLRFRELMLIDSTANVGGLFATLGWAASGAGVWSFIAGYLTTAFIRSFLLRRRSGFRFSFYWWPNWPVLKEVKGFIGGVMAVQLATYTNNNADTLLIGKLLGAASLGQYNIAYQLAMLPLFVLTRCQVVNFSVLSQQNRKQQISFFYQALSLNALMGAFVYGSAFISAGWLIPLIYGEQWTDAVGLFQILCIYAYARLFFKTFGTLLNATNKAGYNGLINWLLIPLSIPAYWYGAQWGGTTGVAISVSAVLGVAGTLGFLLVSTCVAQLSLGNVVKMIGLPTVSMLLALYVVAHQPFVLHKLFEPFCLTIIYLLIASILSRGEVPQTLVKLGKKSFSRPT